MDVGDSGIGSPGGDAGVFEVRAESFQTDVVERSTQQPVLLLFWADQVPPSVDARNQLQALVAQFQGKVALGLIDVAQDQTLAQHLRVQGLPSLRVVNAGQIAEQLDGPQDETVYRELLNRLTLSGADMLRAQLQSLLDNKDFAGAITILQNAVNEEPNNMAFRVELADVLVLQGSLADATQTLATIPADTAERARPQTRLELAQLATELPAVGELEQQLAAQPDALDALYGLAIHAAVAGEFESALDRCMLILQTDREYRDDIGRVTMLQIFELLGKGSEIAKAYRRRLFAYLH